MIWKGKTWYVTHVVLCSVTSSQMFVCINGNDTYKFAHSWCRSQYLMIPYHSIPYRVQSVFTSCIISLFHTFAYCNLPLHNVTYRYIMLHVVTLSDKGIPNRSMLIYRKFMIMTRYDDGDFQRKRPSREHGWQFQWQRGMSRHVTGSRHLWPKMNYTHTLHSPTYVTIMAFVNRQSLISKINNGLVPLLETFHWIAQQTAIERADVVENTAC